MNKTIESIDGLLKHLETETRNEDQLILINRMRLNLALLKQNKARREAQAKRI